MTRQWIQAAWAPERSISPAWGETERSYFRICVAASALIYFVYAALCAKFINYEEYFQVIEFASLKLGLTAGSELPWEFAARIRSWLQPAIYVEIARAAALFDIQRPLTLLFLFRLFTAIVSWASLWMLVLAGRRWVEAEADRRRLYLIAALLWLLPYLGVRTASETMSADMLCIGIALLQWRNDRPMPAQRMAFAVAAGLAFGLCFDFRYSSVVLAAGAALSCLRQPTHRLGLFVGLLLGGVLALAIGYLVDRWGYGAAAFPFLSYLDQNFVVGRSYSFGTSPFYAYLYLPLGHPMAPVALFLVAATLVAWIRRPQNVLVWSAFAYVVALSLTQHKEARFLFPVAAFLPFFVVFALDRQTLRAEWLAARLRMMASGRSLRFLVAWNLCGLFAIPVIDFFTGDFSVYRHIEDAVYSMPAPQNIVLIRDSGRDGYSGILPLHFLEPKSLNWVRNPDVDALGALQSRGGSFLALIDTPNDHGVAANWISEHCAFLHSSLPAWVPRLLAVVRIRSVPGSRTAYRCDSSIGPANPAGIPVR